MKKSVDILQGIFLANPSTRVLYVFPDGNIFSDKNFALNHQRDCKEDMKVINREDLVAAKSPEKPIKAKAQKDETLTLQDQLLGLDLAKPEGPLYNVYKQLRNGLDIETADNKMATIVAALVDEKKRLQTPKPE